MSAADFGATWAAATAAVLIGAVSYSAAGRIRVPPLIVVVSAVVPLLPGLSIYAGLFNLADGRGGTLQIVTAVATALALASGVILGQYLAQPLRRGDDASSRGSPDRVWSGRSGSVPLARPRRGPWSTMRPMTNAAS